MGTDKNRTMQSPKGHTSKEKFDLIVIGSGSGQRKEVDVKVIQRLPL
jgi:hypothetical protein